MNALQATIKQKLNITETQILESSGAASTIIMPEKGDTKAFDKAEKDVNLMFSAVEAQWILTVLDDTLNKLSLVSYLSLDVLADPILDHIDPDVVATIKEHFGFETQYNDMLTERAKRQALAPEYEPEAQAKAMMNEMDLCLSDSTRTVARLLKADPILARRLRELCPKRKPASLAFINTVARLRKLLHNKLRLSAEEEQTLKEQLEKVQEEEADDRKRVQELTEGLATEKNDHRQQLAAKDRKLSRLLKQIEQLTQRTEQERQAFEETMRSEAELAAKVFGSTQEDLLKNLEASEAKLETDGSNHWSLELSHHRKKNHRAVDVEKLISKYDADMMEKHEHLVKLTGIYEDEKEEMRVLQEYFEAVDTELRRQEEEMRVLTEARDRELVLLRRKDHAVIIMQRHFRLCHTRKLIEANKPKDEGKDGKDKKSKKK